MSVDEKRLYSLHEAAPAKGDFVLYWTQIQRRAENNDALNFAVERANELGLPVLVYEGLRHDYPHASDRIHTFVLENAMELRERLEKKDIRHAFYLERNVSDRRKIVSRLLQRAAWAVTDYYPAYIIPGHNRALAEAAERRGVPATAVDACGVIPIAEFPKREYAARTIRPKVHKLLPYYLQPGRDPRPKKSGKKLDPDFREEEWEKSVAELVAECKVDHEVPPVSDFYPGGRKAAAKRLRTFLNDGLPKYDKLRNKPSADVTSRLSPYLHFGMISAREVALAAKDELPDSNPNLEGFLEELIVRRELSYNFCAREPKMNSLTALPDWAQKTLNEHDDDDREHVYTRGEFEAAETHDELWNACQDEIRVTGSMHNYLRMLWGKKILEWSPSHRQALINMTYLNDKYGLDGRDPNSYTSFLWCFGLHDRAWGERPVYGKIRSMSSDSTRRKLDADAYIERIRQLKQDRS